MLLIMPNEIPLELAVHMMDALNSNDINHPIMIQNRNNLRTTEFLLAMHCYR